MRMLRRKSKPLPTDILVLDAIYNLYYDNFKDFSKDAQSRSSKVYVPIDIKSIAKQLGVDGDIVFGRLYYHLENKYSYTRENGTKVSFFTLKAGEDTHCVNFVYLASVLAGLREQEREYKTGKTMAIISLVISTFTLVLLVFQYFAVS